MTGYQSASQSWFWERILGEKSLSSGDVIAEGAILSVFLYPFFVETFGFYPGFSWLASFPWFRGSVISADPELNILCLWLSELSSFSLSSWFPSFSWRPPVPDSLDFPETIESEACRKEEHLKGLWRVGALEIHVSFSTNHVVCISGQYRPRQRTEICNFGPLCPQHVFVLL